MSEDRINRKPKSKKTLMEIEPQPTIETIVSPPIEETLSPAEAALPILVKLIDDRGDTRRELSMTTQEGKAILFWRLICQEKNNCWECPSENACKTVTEKLWPSGRPVLESGQLIKVK